MFIIDHKEWNISMRDAKKTKGQKLKDGKGNKR